MRTRRLLIGLFMSLGIAAVMAALTTPADAAKARRHSRAEAETGPLIVSGMYGPSALRARAPEICRPVTVRVR